MVELGTNLLALVIRFVVDFGLQNFFDDILQGDDAGHLRTVWLLDDDHVRFTWQRDGKVIKIELS